MDDVSVLDGVAVDGAVDRYVQSEFRLVEPSSLVQKPVSALLGVSPAAVTQLGKINIETIFDLANSSLFAAARRIVEAADNPDSELALAGKAPHDMVDASAQTVPVQDLQTKPINLLRGISNQVATDLATALAIKTIRDLAFWPPYAAARSIVSSSFGGSNGLIDPERPRELIPQMGRYPTERIQYQVLLLDKIIEPAPEISRLGRMEWHGAPRPYQPPAETGIALEKAGQIDVATAVGPEAGFQKPALGAVLGFTQSWYTLGLSLGHLLHALALAPGESTRIAVIDWARKSFAKTGETITESDALVSSLDHARSIAEVTAAVAHELQSGEGSSVGTGGSLALGEGGGAAGGGEYGAFKGAATGGHSTGFSAGFGAAHSWASSAGTRDIAAEMTQKIVDSTHQASSMARNRWATAIREISQSEHEQLSTRSVTNFNHMHALTIEYYEIVQVYKTLNELTRVTRCIFLPMKPIDFSLRSIVARFRTAIAAGALTPQIAGGVLSTPNSVVMVPNRPTRPFTQFILDALQSVFGVTVGYPDSTEIVFPRNVQPWGMSFGIEADTANTQEFPFDRVAFDIEGGPTRTIAITDLGPTGASDYGRRFVDLKAAFGTGEDAKSFWNVKSVRLLRKPGREDFAGEIFVLFMIFPYAFNPPPGQGSKGWLGTQTNVAAGETDVLIWTIARTVSNEELTKHLQENSLYYSQVVWASLDSATLGLLLSPYTLQGRPLLELIDPTPFAVAGNYLVFRTYLEDQAWADFLKAKKLEIGRQQETIVALPSGGVFAEAVLGRANSAEKLDITRFWNWQDSPIPIEAPEIAALQAGSRAQAEALTPSQLGAPTINIVTPKDLPDPTGMTAILQAIQNGNMFRDMSGLNATIGFAQAAMARAFDAAKDAAAQAGENAKTAADVLKTMYSHGAGGGSNGSGGGGGGSSSAPTSTDNPSTLGAKANEADKMDASKGSGSTGTGEPPAPTRKDQVLGTYQPGPQGNGSGGAGGSTPKTSTGASTGTGRPFVIGSHWPNTSTPVEGTYDIGLRNEASGAQDSFTFNIQVGRGVGGKVTRLPSGLWSVEARALIDRLPPSLSQIPINVAPGLPPMQVTVNQILALPPAPIYFAGTVNVAATDRAVQLEFTPIFEEATVTQAVTLKAESSATGTFQSQVEGWLEGKVGIIVDEAKAGGKVTAGASVSVTGSLGVDETITAQIKTQIVVGFKITRSA